MNRTDVSSPQVITEVRLFNIPDIDVEDRIFTFNFDIKKNGNKDEVSFTLDLNPSLCNGKVQSSSSPKPVVDTYKFNTNGECLFDHTTDEGYYVNGTIIIIAFKTPVGQFDGQLKNFLFDIETGHINDTPRSINGLFELISPSDDVTK